MTMPTRWLHIEPLDPWFFRDGRPFNAGESVYLETVFPPAPQTLQGFVRAVLFDHHLGLRGIPDRGERRNKAATLELDLSGPYVAGPSGLTDITETLWLPAPLDLVWGQAEDEEDSSWGFRLLQPSLRPVPSDLGYFRLPMVKGRSWEQVADRYVRDDVYGWLLAGNCDGLTRGTNIIPMHLPDGENGACILRHEARVGIARNNATRLAKEGMLYALRLARLASGIHLRVQVGGKDAEHLPSEAVQRFGGEGKLARAVTESGAISLPPPPQTFKCVEGRVLFKLVFITPARLTPWTQVEKSEEEDTSALHANWLARILGWLRRPLSRSDGGATTSWPLHMPEGIDRSPAGARIVSACIGRRVLVGGWNLKKNRSRDLEPCMPAGSVLFCEADAGQESAILALHGRKFGKETKHGFGQVLVGTWTPYSGGA